jgi:hypothetical protein
MAGLLAAPRLTLAKSDCFGFEFVGLLGIFPERLVVLPMFRQPRRAETVPDFEPEPHMGCATGAGTLEKLRGSYAPCSGLFQRDGKT